MNIGVIVVLHHDVGHSSTISWREQVTFWWDDGVRFVLVHHAELKIYSDNKTVTGYTCSSTRTHYAESESTSL